MNKSDYNFGIFIMVLAVMTGFLHAVVYLGKRRKKRPDATAQPKTIIQKAFLKSYR